MNGENQALWSDELGNVADVWRSEDGTNWENIIAGAPWGARHVSLTFPGPSGGVLMAAGYGHGGPERIYADVWYVRK